MPKRPAGPRPVVDVLADGDAVGGLAVTARADARILSALRRALPPDVAPHLGAAHLRDATLVVSADGPAWATRLRFLEPELKAALDARTRRIVRRVEVRVAPPAPPARPAPAPAAKPLSSAARAAIEAGADGVRDPAIAAALRRLARRR